MIFNKISTFFNPERFQGQGKKRRYFEGWYFKIVDQTENYAFAIIPGVAMDDNGKKQSFIQVLNGKKQTAVYHKFDLEQFISANNKFEISIGTNSFSQNHIQLDLPELKGSLQFENLVGWPKPFIRQALWDLLHLCRLWNVTMELSV